MDEEYDVIVCGTGLKECILGGLLSCDGKKVLHLDTNSYYGGESASLNLSNLYSKFREGSTPPEKLGPNRKWNVDLVPKFVMSCGKLVKMLVKTQVNRYLDWLSIEGTYVYQYQAAGFFTSAKAIHKVPATDMEVIMSNLMNLTEKNRCRNFLKYCAQWSPDNPESWKAFDPKTTTMETIFEHYGLKANTIDFVGHAVALYTNDEYRKQPCEQTLEKINLYMNSFNRYGKSPFLYPIYGLGGLPEGFSRLCAINGGTFMLNKPVEGFEYGEDGKVTGVKSSDGVAKGKIVICEPRFLLNTPKIKPNGRVIRSICILNAPVPQTNNANSCQIIIPQKQIARHHDVYITVVSSNHGVAEKDRYIALISTTVETDDPEKEIKPALDLLGHIEERFTQISDVWLPTDNGSADNVHVTASYDATSHFESASDDVLRIWEDITGKPFDLGV